MEEKKEILISTYSSKDRWCRRMVKFPLISKLGNAKFCLNN